MAEVVVQADKLSTYLAGLEVNPATPWNNLDDIVVSPGEAYVPGFGDIVELAAATSIPAGALAASTSYYIYLYADPTTGAGMVEASTTAPAAPYRGAAKTKTGDTSRRYLKMERTSASSILYRNKMRGNWVQINENPMGSSTAYMLTSDGRSTSPTAISCSGKIPAHVRRVMLHLQHWGIGYVGFATSEMNFTLNEAATAWAKMYGVQNGWGTSRMLDIVLNESQEFTYDYNSDPGAGNGLGSGIAAYLEER